MLKGIGTIGGNVTVVPGGVIAPGNSPGTLNVTGDLDNQGTLEFQIAGTGPGQFDVLNVSGTFAAGGIIALILDGYTPAAGDSFQFMSFGAFIDNGYSFDLSQAALPGGMTWDLSGFSTTGGINLVPEPGTLALAALGALGVLLCPSWRRRASAPGGFPAAMVRSRQRIRS